MSRDRSGFCGPRLVEGYSLLRGLEQLEQWHNGVSAGPEEAFVTKESQVSGQATRPQEELRVMGGPVPFPACHPFQAGTSKEGQRQERASQEPSVSRGSRHRGHSPQPGGDKGASPQ